MTMRIDIRDCGGVADSKTDNRAALREAIARAYLSGVRRVYFPAAAGRYHFAAPAASEIQ